MIKEEMREAEVHNHVEPPALDSKQIDVGSAGGGSSLSWLKRPPQNLVVTPNVPDELLQGRVVWCGPTPVGIRVM
jgi:hypothetical protein